MSKVFISAGHGGSDPGAMANGLKEKDLNLSIALACRDHLEEYGVEVKMSRTTDEDDGIVDEANESNAFSPDLSVSIHNNAGGGDGIEVWYSIDGSGLPLANNILAEAVKIGQNSRGAKSRMGANNDDYYGFLRLTNATAVIVECAFVDNATDIQIIDTAEEQKKMGVAIAKGILTTLGISEKPVKPTTPSTSTSNIKINDVVSIMPGAKYYTGKDIPDWVEKKDWIVKSINGDRVVIDKSADGKSSINSPVNAKDLVVVRSPQSEMPFLVRVSIPNLNIRTGPGTNYKARRFTGIGTFTIVEVENGPGSESGWGRLKSGAGWISLDYAKKI